MAILYREPRVRAMNHAKKVLAIPKQSKQIKMNNLGVLNNIYSMKLQHRHISHLVPYQNTRWALQRKHT
jgi:hypothetical protein